MVGGAIGTKTLTEAESGVGESGAPTASSTTRYPDRVDELVLVQSKTHDAVIPPSAPSSTT